MHLAILCNFFQHIEIYLYTQLQLPPASKKYLMFQRVFKKKDMHVQYLSYANLVTYVD